MAFADDLNNKVNDFNRDKPIVPDKESLISKTIERYTRDIKNLCIQHAKTGKTSLKGFFVPYREVSYDYEYGPYVVDRPQSYVTMKPTEGKSGSLTGGACDLSQAVIGIDNDSTVDIIGNGIVGLLSKDGFKKLSILHIVGPKYVESKGVFGVRAIEQGICHYFFLEIEW